MRRGKAASDFRFADLYLGPRYGPDLRGTAACTGLCGRTEILVRCRNRCRNAWVREILCAIVERRLFCG